MIFDHLRKKDILLLAASVGLIFIQVWLELEIPGYMSKITNIMTGGEGAVLDEGIPMMACAFGSLIMSVVVGLIIAYVGTSMGKSMRAKQFDRVESYSAAEINKFSIYSLITRSTNDVNQVQMAFILGFMAMVRAPIMAVMAIMKISTKNIGWVEVSTVCILAMVISIIVILWFTFPRFKKIQWMNDDVNRLTKESLSGIRVVHAYNAEAYQEAKFQAANAELTGTHLSVTRAMAFLLPIMTTTMCMLSLGIYWMGAIIISEAGAPAERLVDFSDMIVFSSYAMQIIMAFMMLIIVFMVLPRARVSARRIDEVIRTEPTVLDGTVTESPEGQEGRISFNDVSFRFPRASEDALTDISFDVDRGETVAIIGPTGSGKSTLVRLILRFYDVSGGSITLDGVDVKDYTLAALHKKVGYVPQKAVMFNGTIYSNVNYGDTEGERTEDDVRKAIEIAQATQFVENTEGGYQGKVAEGGTNLSGGQKQRISIARAVCRKPEFYIFDDSFSALDYKTDRMLRTRLKEETAGVTTLIVAQRIGTIKDADKIIVLNEGRIVGMGRHQDLLKDCDVYYQIARSQLSEEELVR